MSDLTRIRSNDPELTDADVSVSKGNELSEHGDALLENTVITTLNLGGAGVYWTS
jgi:hypothetical protein